MIYIHIINIQVLYMENHCNTQPLVAYFYRPESMRTHLTVSLLYPNPELTITNPKGPNSFHKIHKSIRIITLTVLVSQHTLYVFVFYFIPLMCIIAKEYVCKCLCECLCVSGPLQRSSIMSYRTPFFFTSHPSPLLLTGHNNRTVLP